MAETKAFTHPLDLRVLRPHLPATGPVLDYGCGDGRVLHELHAAGFRQLIYSMVALVFWGVFSAAQKETTNYISAEWSYVSFIVSSGLVALVFAGLGWTSLALPTQTLGLGLLAGMLNGLGVLASFAAYSAEGKASKVITIAGALQPVFTIVLALVFLSESFSLWESLGILLAIVGALTLSYEKPPVPKAASELGV